MRVATFNVLHGRDLEDGRVDGGRLRDAVATLEADVVGLQEVDRGQDRSHRLDLAAEAARYDDGVSYRYVPTLVGTPGGRWRAATDADCEAPQDCAEPSYGIALLTRLPVRSWHVRRLHAVPVRSPVLVARRRVLWLKDEPRVLLAAVVEAPFGELTVATTHLSFLPGWNAYQLRSVVSALRELPSPRVLAGDLNLPTPLPRVLTGWEMLADLPSYPRDEPRVQLDHVIADGDLPPVCAAESRALPLSDHRAVVAELEGPESSVPEDSGACGNSVGGRE